MAMLTRKEMRDKAERTTSAATDIINCEKAASEAKTARLKALRAAKEEAATGSVMKAKAGKSRLSGSATGT